LETAPWHVDASDRGDRVYAVGAFSTLNGAPLTRPHLAVLDTATGAEVPGLLPWQPPDPATNEPSNTILEAGDAVYQGGSQHYLHQYDRDTYALERAQFTKTAGGDYQAIAVKDGVVYASCHCTDWQYQDTNVWPVPRGYSQVQPIQLIGAYDQGANLEQLPEFHPSRLVVRGAAGPWALTFDAVGCMWAGGDFMRPGATSTAFYGGYERFCDRDSTAPSSPTAASATMSGDSVTLAWAPSTDAGSTAVTYEVLEDDKALGTIVVATTSTPSFVDVVPPGTTARYFVRARDLAGNWSATTPVLPVSNP
jgi:hypothetical protein